MKSILFARISDNVLEEDDWPVRKLYIDGKKIVKHEDVEVTSPAYDFSSGPQTGWSMDQLLEWSARDFTGTHPEVFHELKPLVAGDTSHRPWRSDFNHRPWRSVFNRERLILLISEGETP